MALVYAASSNIEAENSGTTISTQIPTEAVDGSFIAAFLMSRSNPLTPPAGWTLATSAQTLTGTDQWSYIYYKEASGDAGTSPTWSQPSSGRMMLQYMVFTGGGTPALATEQVLNDATSLPQTIPNDGAVVGASLVLNTFSVVAVASGDTGSYSNSEGWRITEQLSSDNRMISAYTRAPDGYNSWGTFNHTTSNASSGVCSATAVFAFANGVGNIAPRVSQEPVLVLNNTEGNPRIGVLPVMVLWELAGSVAVSQLPIQVLNRRIERRIIGITD